MLIQQQVARKQHSNGGLELPVTSHVVNGLAANGAKLHEPEMKLVVLAARTNLDDRAKERLALLIDERLNWDEIISAAAAHGVVPILFRNLGPYAKDIPSSALERLRDFTLQNSLHNLYLAGELTKLIKIMEESGINALPYKGPLLAATIYGDLSLRQFSDLDILIPRKDLQNAKELFSGIGYAPSNEKTESLYEAHLKSGRAYNYKFVSANGRSRVELHWQFTSKYNSFIFDYQQLEARLMRVDFGGQQVRNLKPEDLLLILSQHGSKHFWQRLLWLCDIAELLKKHKELDWTEIMSRAEGMGIRRILFLGLHLVERLFESELPDEVVVGIKNDRSVKKLADRIEEQLFSGDSKLIKGFETHTFSCRMRERLRDKFRYAGYRVSAYVDKATAPTAKDRDALPSALKFSTLAYVFRPPRLLVENIKKAMIKKTQK